MWDPKSPSCWLPGLAGLSRGGVQGQDRRRLLWLAKLWAAEDILVTARKTWVLGQGSHRRALCPEARLFSPATVFPAIN